MNPEEVNRLREEILRLYHLITSDPTPLPIPPPPSPDFPVIDIPLSPEPEVEIIPDPELAPIEDLLSPPLPPPCFQDLMDGMGLAIQSLSQSPLNLPLHQDLILPFPLHLPPHFPHSHQLSRVLCQWPSWRSLTHNLH